MTGNFLFECTKFGNSWSNNSRGLLGVGEETMYAPALPKPLNSFNTTSENHAPVILQSRFQIKPSGYAFELN